VVVQAVKKAVNAAPKNFNACLNMASSPSCRLGSFSWPLQAGYAEHRAAAIPWNRGADTFAINDEAAVLISCNAGF